MNLSQKNILITGAGRGLGKALALALAAAGGRLALVARNRKELKQTEQEIRAAGGLAHALPGDVGRKESVYPLVGQAAALLGPLDLLVNNASALGDLPLRDLAETDCESFQRVLETNLVGPFRLIKAVVGSLWIRDAGLILNISSDAAVEAYAKWGSYGVSKAGLDHLTRIFAAEFQGSHVRFLSVDPGEMDTRMHAEAMPEADRSLLASPRTVAARIKRLIEAAESFPSGSRVVLSQWKEDLHGASSRPMAS